MDHDNTNLSQNLTLQSILDKDTALNTQDEEQELSDTDNQKMQFFSVENDSFSSKYDNLKAKLNFGDKQQQIKIVKNVLAGLALFFVYIYFTFFLSHTCPEEEFPSEDDCMQYLNDNMSLWLSRVFWLSLIVNIVFCLSHNKVVKPWFRYVIPVIFIFLCFVQYNINPASANVREYSGAQCLILLALTLIIWVIFQMVYGLILLYQKKRYIFVALMVLVFVFFFFFFRATSKSCNGWEKGLKDDIDFGNEYCEINKPSVCWPVVIDNWFKMGPDTCDLSQSMIQKNKKHVLETYGFVQNKEDLNNDSILSNTQYLAWPLLNKFSHEDRTYNVVQDNFMSRTKVVNNVYEGFEKGAEVVVDLDANNMHINVKRNKTLVEERQKIFEENQEKLENQGKEKIQSMSKNVIIVYIDTLSRAQTYRKLPKTIKYFENIIKNKEQDKKIYEFFRFHSMDKKTINNVLKMNYDYRYEDIYKELKSYNNKLSSKHKVANLINEYKEAGYITGHVQNTCTSQCLFRKKYQNLEQYFNQTAADHEFSIWDPLYIKPGNYYDLSQGPGAIQRRCLYGNDTYNFMLEYGEQFLEQYKTEKKFLYLEFTDSHELTSEVVQYMDDGLSQFFENIDKLTGEDTVLYLMSDHGQHLVQPFYSIEAKVDPEKQYDKFMRESMPSRDVYHTERMLPLLFIMVSSDVHYKYQSQIENNLQNNQQIIQAMGQLRNTFMQNAYGLDYDSKYNDSIFNKRLSSQNCMDIGQVSELDPQLYCVCRPYNWRDLIKL